LAAFLVRYSYNFLVSFQLQEKETTSVNLLFEFAMIAIPIVTWSVASFCITSIMSGESKFSEIFMSSAYCLVPYIILAPILGVFSHILSSSESGIFSFLKLTVLVWVILLLFLSMLRMNDYGFIKAIGVCVLSVLFMVLILAVIVLLIALSVQLVVSVLDFLKEVQLKYIY